VTEKATALLREVQADQTKTAGEILRLGLRGDRFGLTLDAPNDDDQVFTSEGQDVLLVSPDLRELLTDVTIDAEETPEGGGLTFSVPG
jgi:Fe-S cluster assembly iron-binding protein IscA